MSATIPSRISRQLIRIAPCAAALLAVVIVTAPAHAETSRVTVITGGHAAQQSFIAGARSEQIIRITIEDPVRPGIRRAPVAEPVLYVIESDDAVRAVR